MPKIWTDQVLGERIGIGATEFSRESIMTFARVYDPQSFLADVRRHLSSYAAA